MSSYTGSKNASSGHGWTRRNSLDERERIGTGLAESWTESPDGLVYEFKLCQGLRFHNGDPCTTHPFPSYEDLRLKEA